MAKYVKENWVDGQTIASAERMNHIEQGIEDSIQLQYGTTLPSTGVEGEVFFKLIEE